MPLVPWLLFALAAAIRWFGCAVTPVPGRDGIAYLWMAQQWTEGDPTALFATVFHPLYPTLIGTLLWLAPGLDVVIAGQLASAIPAAIAVLPLWWLTRRLFGEQAALWTGLIYAIGSWFVQHPADCMSEGPFYLLAAVWALGLTAERPRTQLSGLAAGLAFLARPEAAALIATGALFLFASGRRTGALLHTVSGLAVSLLQPLGSSISGRGFSLTPKAAFNWDVGAGGADSAWSWYCKQGLQLPGDAWEGLGYLVFPLAIAGIVRWRPRRLGDPRLLLLLPLAMQCVVVPLLKSHHRFVSGLGILVLPFAGAAFAAALPWLRQRGRAWPALLVIALFGSEAKLFVDWPVDRTIERDLGRWLHQQRAPTELVASDMPRLLFFAGLPPPPPRRIGAADLLERARDPRCHFVALKRGRTALAPAVLEDLGYAARALPTSLAQHPDHDRIMLYYR